MLHGHPNERQTTADQDRLADHRIVLTEDSARYKPFH